MKATGEQCRLIWAAMRQAGFTPQWASHLSYAEASIVLTKFTQLAEGGTEHDNAVHGGSPSDAGSTARSNK